MKLISFQSLSLLSNLIEVTMILFRYLMNLY